MGVPNWIRALFPSINGNPPRPLLTLVGATVVDQPNGGPDGEGASLVTIGSSAGIIYPESYGAKGDGVTNDNAAFVAAFAALAAASVVGTGPRALVLGSNRTYLLTQGFTVPAGCSVLGQGVGNSVLYMNTSSNFTMLTTGGENCAFDGFAILSPGTSASQVGILSAFNYTRVTNVLFTGLNTGLQLNAYPLSHRGGYFGNLVAEACGLGFDISGSAEYNTFVGIHARGCAQGMVWAAGNNSWVGGEITDCPKGIEVVGGTNDGHGAIVGVAFNHCGAGDANHYAVKADSAVANGQQFTACQFYDNDIYLVSSNGVRFVGCEFGAVSFVFDGSVGTVFDAAMVFSSEQTGASSTITNNANSHPSTTKWMLNCVDIDGTFPTWLEPYLDATDWQSWSAGYVIAGGHGAGTFFTVHVGPMVGAETTDAGLWMLPYGVARTGGNYALQASSTDLWVQARTGSGKLHLAAGATDYVVIDAGNAVVEVKVFPLRLDNISDPGTPTGGPWIWGQAGALKARGTGGTTATLVAADLEGFAESGGHCPSCGTDFAYEWSNPKYGLLTVCMVCLANELGHRPWIRRIGPS